MNDNRIAAEVFDRYVAGLSNAEESSAVEQLLRERGEFGELIEAMRGLPAGEEGVSSQPVDSGAAWQKLRKGRGEGSLIVPVLVRRNVGIFSREGLRKWVGYTGVVGVACLVLAAIGFQLRNTLPNVGTRTQSHEYRTSVSQRARVVLSDGSHVTLGPSSRLTFAATGSAREANVEGEAYFEVTPDAAAPFTVRTRQTSTRVLGTAFNVRALPQDTSTVVVVASGRVSVKALSSSTQEAILTGATMAQVNINGSMAIDRDVNVDKYLGWTDGRLVFTGSRLTDVGNEIERWYGVKIAVAKSASEYPVTATFNTAMPVSQLMEHLALLANLDIKQSGQTIHIEKR